MDINIRKNWSVYYWLGTQMSVNIEFSIWLASKTRWAHLSKTIEMPVVPRVGEFVKFANKKQGDYFAWRITEVTYRESGQIEVWTELLDNVDDRGYSFESEEEFDDYFNSYIAENWRCERGIGPNKRYKGSSGFFLTVPNKRMGRTRKTRRSS